MSARLFDASKITDQKRLVRGEHLLAARTHLRVRDHIHHKAWRVLLMAGAAPHGEVTAVRELMPKSHIVAVDREAVCLEAAIDAGVDEVVQCDLEPVTTTESYTATDWEGREIQQTSKTVTPPAALAALPRFDIVSLDLCCGASRDLKQLVHVNERLVSHGGVYIVTFSYGRDVTEVYTECFDRYTNSYPVAAEAILRAGIPKHIAGRIAFLFPGYKWFGRMASVMTYRGSEMPMISVLFHTKRPKLSFVQVESGDFELAVTCPDPALLYACPQERIESLRRSHAALRAAYTTKNKKTALGR